MDGAHELTIAGSARTLAFALLISGAVVLVAIFSANALPPVGASIDLSTTSVDLTVIGADPGEQLGIDSDIGDLNGDTVGDLLIGAYAADGPGTGTACGSGQVGDRCGAGEAYVFYGGTSLPSIIDLATTSADVTVYGAAASDAFGRAVLAADINDDGTNDLISGSVIADPGGRTDAGAVYVFFGGPSLPSVIDLATDTADLTVYGRDPGDYLSYSIGAGDLNGDTVVDLIVGARLGDGAGSGTSCGAGGIGDRCDAGEAYVIYGGSNLPATFDLSSDTPDVTIWGDDPGGLLSRSVETGDVSGDGTADLLLGAPFASPAGRFEAGMTYMVRGGPSLPATIDLATANADFTVLGGTAGDGSGWSLATGDLNDDGTADLVTTAWVADPPGGTQAGETYAFYGGPGLTGTLDLATGVPDLTLRGDDADDRSGFSVAIEDFDGDTRDDLGMGAIWASPAGRTRAGEAYLIYGQPSIPSVIDLNKTTAGLSVQGDSASDWTGASLGSGDLNDDGVADLSIGAVQAGDGGRLYVIFGGALESSPTPTPGTPVPTKQPEPGDTDGDGCRDQAENGPDEQHGGRRDYLNPYDFYDVAGPGGGPKDKHVDLANDILGVMLRYTANPTLPYDAAYDRGHAPPGQDVWDMTGPDGSINLPDDILGVIFQYQHDCT